MDAARPYRYTDLDFNAPLSDAHADELISALRVGAHEKVVDLGCGWGELLLRVLAAEPTARGVGVEQDEANVARARANADARGLGERVDIEQGDATNWSGAADVAIVIGASHAWGGTAPTLDAVRPRLRRGGRLLLGEGIWEQPCTAAALAALDAQPDDFLTSAGLVDVCLDRGFRMLSFSTATIAEWDSFESRFAAGRERWLAANPDSPHAVEVRAELDRHRNEWLNGYRGILGFAYLVLGLDSSAE
jgi:cyclopropane fatty-acyl-phospholipid synthase-like methyltransferase